MARRASAFCRASYLACVARYTVGLADSAEYRTLALRYDIFADAMELKRWIDHSRYTLSQVWRGVQYVARGETVEAASRAVSVGADDLHYVVDHLSTAELQTLFLIDDGAIDRPVVVLDHIIDRLRKYCSTLVRIYWPSVGDASMQRYDFWAETLCAGMSAAFSVDWLDELEALYVAMRAAKHRAINIVKSARSSMPHDGTDALDHREDVNTPVKVLQLLHGMPPRARAEALRVVHNDMPDMKEPLALRAALKKALP